MEAEETFWRLTWERFVAGGSTAIAFGAWGADEWGPERRYLTVLAEVGGPGLEGLAVRDADAAGCRPVLADGLHLMVQELGFADVVQAELPDRVGDALEGLSAVEVEVTGVCSFPDAVVAQVTPFEPVRKWRRTIRQAVPELAADGGDPDRPASEGGMAPHITLSYYDRELPTGEVADRLRQSRVVEPIAVRIRELSLMSVRRPTGTYFTWDVIKRFPLGRVDA